MSGSRQAGKKKPLKKPKSEKILTEDDLAQKEKARAEARADAAARARILAGKKGGKK